MLYEHAFDTRGTPGAAICPSVTHALAPRRQAQAEDAEALLLALRAHVLAARGPLLGYGKAAALIGRKNSEGAHLSQVCSRIDLACYHAGLPLLTLHWVRRHDGEVNHDSLVNWRAFAQELIDASVGHAWSRTDLDFVQRRLQLLPPRSAAALWTAVEALGPASIRRQLHRAVAHWARPLHAA